MNLEDLDKDQLQRLCMKLGIDEGKLWDKKSLLYLIKEKKEEFRSRINDANRMYYRYNRYIELTLYKLNKNAL